MSPSKRKSRGRGRSGERTGAAQWLDGAPAARRGRAPGPIARRRPRRPRAEGRSGAGGGAAKASGPRGSGRSREARSWTRRRRRGA
uniref:Uncharacterized protein n=1 Tax=Arundo donax TaxID=35708 RepID=A0A0A9GL09_ARUDO